MNYKKNVNTAESISRFMYPKKEASQDPFDHENKEPKNAEEILINTILNFDKTDNPFGDLQTIYDFLCKNMQIDADVLLEQCQAIQRMIYHLEDDNYDNVNIVLITLYQFSLISNFTKHQLCDNIEIFYKLLSNDHIIFLFPNFSNLLYQVVSFDDGEATCELVSEYSFIEKVVEKLPKPYDNQNIFVVFINLITGVLKKFYKFYNRGEFTGKEEINLYHGGVHILSHPLTTVQYYIESDDGNVLYPILKLYRIILIYRKGELINTLTPDIFDRIIKLLTNFQKIDIDGLILRRVLKIIEVFIFIYLEGNTKDDYSNQFECIITNLIELVNVISSPLTDPNVHIQKAQKWLPYIIDLLGRISKYKNASFCLSQKKPLCDLFQIYDNLDCTMKSHLLEVFINVFINNSDSIAEYIEDPDVSDTCYNFFDVIINDSIDSLQNFGEEERKNKASLICESLYNLFTIDNDIKNNIFATEEIIEFLDEYQDFNDCFDWCRKVRELFQDEDESELEL